MYHQKLLAFLVLLWCFTSVLLLYMGKLSFNPKIRAPKLLQKRKLRKGARNYLARKEKVFMRIVNNQSNLADQSSPVSRYLLHRL